jgi:hypothetical protein
MAFHCSICGEESTGICVWCTKDTCANHLCEKCARCSDCCECEVPLREPARDVPPVRPAVPAVAEPMQAVDEALVGAPVVEEPHIPEAPEAPEPANAEETAIDPVAVEPAGLPMPEPPPLPEPMPEPPPERPLESLVEE